MLPSAWLAFNGRGPGLRTSGSQPAEWSALHDMRILSHKRENPGTGVGGSPNTASPLLIGL